jgi:hypothetical protein
MNLKPYPRMFVSLDRAGKVFQEGLVHVSWAAEEDPTPAESPFLKEVVFKDASDKETDHWKANHAAAVFRSRVLLERTDLSLERVRAYGSVCKMQDRLLSLEVMLERLIRDSQPVCAPA